VTLIQLDRIGVILDGALEVLLLAVGEPPVVVEVRFVWLDLDCHSKTIDCLLVVALPVK